MKMLFLLSIPFALVVVWLTTTLSGGAQKLTTVTSQGPTVERLERLAHLVTTRVYVADVLVGEGEGCRGAWLIKGDALLGVDMRRVQIADKDDVAKQAMICLPLPTILQPRVDHTKTRTWEVRRTTWVPWNADADKLRDEVMRRAQELVGNSAAAAENIEQAKASAETTLRAFYQELGWQVNVRWEAPPATSNPPSPPTTHP